MITVIVPFYNEEQNIQLLYDELKNVLVKMKVEWEIVFVDDGSTDNGKDVAQKLQKDTHVKVASHGRRLGKGAGLVTGIKYATGDTLIFMDGDLQDDPKDIPAFYDTLNAGYDLVNGYRIDRKDNAIIRFYSNSASVVLRKLLHSPFHDINCGFKILRKSITDEIVMYANNFRFLPLAAYFKGFRVAEIPVHNRVRKYGKSKYRFKKLFIGLIDTFSAYFLYQFSERPLHFFGILGGALLAIGGIILFELTIERLFFHVLLYRRPLLLFAILFIVSGLQIIMTGFIGELIVYHHKSRMKK